MFWRENKIEIEKIYTYQDSLVVGLSINSYEEFPLVIGCSIRNKEGVIIDIPARFIKKKGAALWVEKNIPKTCQIIEKGKGCSWEGEIIFALWLNNSLSKRLADTGWVQWYIPWMIGASTAGLDMQDEEIKSKYSDVMDVWSAI